MGTQENQSNVVKPGVCRNVRHDVIYQFDCQSNDLNPRFKLHVQEGIYL